MTRRDIYHRVPSYFSNRSITQVHLPSKPESSSLPAARLYPFVVQKSSAREPLTHQRSRQFLRERREKMSSIIQRLYSLPRELITKTQKFFTLEEIQDLKGAHPIVTQDLIKQERSQDAIHNERLACFACLQMLPKWKFGPKQIRKKKRRNGNHQKNRCCIDCFIKTQARRGDDIVTNLAISSNFFICEKCGCPGRRAGYVANPYDSGGRSLTACESCKNGTSPVPYHTILNEIWSARRDVDP